MVPKVAVDAEVRVATLGTSAIIAKMGCFGVLGRIWAESGQKTNGMFSICAYFVAVGCARQRPSFPRFPCLSIDPHFTLLYIYL